MTLLLRDIVIADLGKRFWIPFFFFFFFVTLARRIPVSGVVCFYGIIIFVEIEKLAVAEFRKRYIKCLSSGFFFKERRPDKHRQLSVKKKFNVAN